MSKTPTCEPLDVSRLDVPEDGLTVLPDSRLVLNGHVPALQLLLGRLVAPLPARAPEQRQVFM